MSDIWWRIEASRRKFKYGDYLLPSQVKPFHHFLDAGARLDILENDGDGHTGVAKNPSATNLARDAFHGRTL